MSALNFPDNPADVGNVYIGDNGVTYDYVDGKWRGRTAAGTGNANTGNFTFNADTITNANGLILATDRGTLAIGSQLETPGVAGHLHIAFDNSNVSPPASDLFLGDDYNYVKLPGYYLNTATQYGIELGTNDRNGGGENNWQFGTDGTTSFPNNAITTSNTPLTIQTKLPVTYGPFDDVYFASGNGSVNGVHLSGYAGYFYINIVNVNNDGTYSASVYPPAIQNGTNPTYTISGVDLGGTSPANDCLLSVTTVDDVITNISVSGTPFLTKWIFGADGTTTFPTGGHIGNTKGGTMLDGGFGSGASLTSFYPSGMFSSCVTANANGTLNITTYGDGVGVGGQWLFGLDGSTSLPNGVAYKSSGTVVCAAGADTVVYTGTAQYQMTFKLLLKVEGIEGSNGTEDTQSTEMIVARGNRANAVAASVYGVVHTSVAPLATFTAQWNAVTSRVEITCRPTSLSNSVIVIAFATEISTSH